jgi:hypothetical protein
MPKISRAAATLGVVAGALVSFPVPSAMAQALTPSAMMLLPTRHSIPAVLKVSRGRIVAISRAATRFPGPGDNSVTLLDRSGNELFSRAPSQDLPDAKVVTLEDAALTATGSLVVAVEAQDAQGVWAAALIVYDMQSKRTERIVRTTPVICRYVTADDDNTIWCLGLDVEKVKAKQNDYNVFWRYSLDGRVLGSSVSRAQWPPAPALSPWSMFPRLTTVRGIVTAWLPVYRTLIEFTAGGPRTTVAAPSPSSIAGEKEDFVALGGGRALILAVSAGDAQQRDTIRRSAFTLDTGGAWRPTASFPALPFGFWAIGSDDGQVVLWDRYQRRVLWVPEAQFR